MKSCTTQEHYFLEQEYSKTGEALPEWTLWCEDDGYKLFIEGNLLLEEGQRKLLEMESRSRNKKG
jgi:hypothetical protein